MRMETAQNGRVERTHIEPDGAWRDHSSGWRERAGGWIWLLAVQFFVAQAVVQAGWTTPYSLRDNFISDLGNTACGVYLVAVETWVCSPWHAWMNASFVLLGAQIVVGAALLGRTLARGRLAGAGLAMLSLAGPGLVLVGVFPENENLPPHKLGAAMQFVVGNAGLAVLGWTFVRHRGRLVFGTVTGLAGIFGLAATAFFVAECYLGLGIGGMERVAAWPLPLWLSLAGALALRRR